MGRYDNDYDSSPVAARQRDLVLSINEFCFLQNKTNGTIKSHVGPLTMTISFCSMLRFLLASLPE